VFAPIIILVHAISAQDSTRKITHDTARLGFGQKVYRSISTPRIVVAALFASTVAFMLLLAGDGMEILTSARGFVAAEARWSKAEKDAVFYLQRYASTQDENAYRKFKKAIAVPLDFEQIRIELAKNRPDLKVVDEVCKRNGIHSADTAGMLELYRRFANVAYMRRAIDLWGEADTAINGIARTGETLHAKITSGTANPVDIAMLADDAIALQERIPVLANAFSDTFGEGARWARDLFKWTIFISAALLLTLGILITWRLLSEAIEAKEKYRQLINTANDAILVADRGNGRIIQANLKAERMTGISAEELIGRNIRDFLASDFEGTVDAVLKGEPTVDGHGMELTVKHTDGHMVPVEASVNLTTLDRKVVVQSLLRDISERRRLEAQLRQAAKMDAVGRLAGGVAHDFNNLLTVIAGYGELLQSQIVPEDPVYTNLEQILKAADRATSLTKQLLAFSRHHMMKPKVLDLNETISGVEKMLRRLIGENISLEFRPYAGLGYVKADPSQIEQVIVNLAVNARDAMPGGGRLSIATRNVELSEKQTASHAFLRPGSYVSLSVSDNGTGMDEKTAACIFEPFFTTKESGKGTGLGLAMVYGTVKQSGGYVLVRSELGKGTTFELYLPRVYNPKTEQVEEQSSTPGGGSETILVVEDQTELRGLLRTVLQRSGYSVVEAQDGKFALAAYNKHRNSISLVITDVVMPEMGGVDLGAHLREQSEGLKILYISGYTDTLLPRQSVPAGAAFLQKPFTPELLARTVRDVLDGRSEQASGAEDRLLSPSIRES
jgi:two-component system cell cycle sensor histidine kinase/response regulator CckA